MLTQQTLPVAFLCVAAILAFLLIRQYIPIGLLITARSAGVRDITPVGLFCMRLRKVPQDRIVMPLIAAASAGVPIRALQLEAFYLAGGNVDEVVKALIRAHRAQVPLTFEEAAAADLAGGNVLEEAHI